MRVANAILHHMETSDMLLLREVYAVVADKALERPRESWLSPGKCVDCGHPEAADILECNDVHECETCGAKMFFAPAPPRCKKVVSYLHEQLRAGNPIPHEMWWDLWMAMRMMPAEDDTWDLVPYVVVKGMSIDRDLCGS